MRKRSVRGIHPLPSLRQLHHVSAERLVEALMALDRLGYPGRSDCHPGPADRLLNAARKTTTASSGIIGHPGKCGQSESAARPTASTAATSRSDDRPIRSHKEEPHPFTRPSVQIPQPVPAGMFRADAVAVRNPVAYALSMRLESRHHAATATALWCATPRLWGSLANWQTLRDTTVRRGNTQLFLKLMAATCRTLGCLTAS